MDKKRVVITGMGVVAPNGVGVENYFNNLLNGVSGIKHSEEMESLNLRCQVSGMPDVSQEYIESKLPRLLANSLGNRGIVYACLAALEAWEKAGLPIDDELKENIGMVFGSGALGLDTSIGEIVSTIESGNSRRLGSRKIPQSMNSGAAAHINYLLGLGGPVLSNSSACITGSEALLTGYDQIQLGKADIMLCGSTEGDGRYIWAGFDAMRVLCSDSNDSPETASRPMSTNPTGFVPASGAGAIVIETLESALERNATIYAEVLGGHQNSGGLRNGGTMTAPNSTAVVGCIQTAIKKAGVHAQEIDLINGHLTSTKGDVIEIQNWVTALGRKGSDFPYINTPKSMIGHCIAGAGSIELNASILQLYNQQIHANLNTKSLNPIITDLIDSSKIVDQSQKVELNTVIKANFGFGDLNCAVVLRKFEHGKD
ncbi:MAG: beta-ketoacyl-[acyl-carrier-protein] synthase family protein [Cyclobacteriaceae bacterium]